MLRDIFVFLKANFSSEVHINCRKKIAACIDSNKIKNIINEFANLYRIQAVMFEI